MCDGVVRFSGWPQCEVRGEETMSRENFCEKLSVICKVKSLLLTLLWMSNSEDRHYSFCLFVILC